METKTCLVTGGAGFIGSNFVKYLLAKYGTSLALVVLDKLTYAGNIISLESVMDRITFIKGDISDEVLVREIFEVHNIDFVVNCAAESHVDRSICDPRIFFHTNILGTQNLVEISRTSWEVGGGSYKPNVKFLQVSTDEVYGSLGAKGIFTENSPLNPSSPYAASKAGADMVIKAYVETYAFPANITRCSNNYGPYQFPEKLIPLTINNILEGRGIPLYGDGKNIRDWLYVEDHCAALDAVLHGGRNGEVYNVGSNNEKQNIDIVKCIIDTIAHIMRTTPEYRARLKTDISDVSYDLIAYVEDRKGHDKRYAVDPAKITAKLKWKPMASFDEWIGKTVLWYLENQDWLESVASGEYRDYYQKMYAGGRR